MRRHCAFALLAVITLTALHADAAPAKTTHGHPQRQRHAARQQSRNAREDQHWKQTYTLVLDQGCPVVTDYKLNGQAVKPLIDTGSPIGLYVPEAVYRKLELKAPTTAQIVSQMGKTWTQETAQVLAPMLGSGRKRWFDVAVAPAAPAGSEPELGDSIFPLDMLDGNIALFLLSRNQLWVGMDTPPEEVLDKSAEAAEMNSIPYFDTTSALLVTIACEGKHYFAQIDTGAAGTSFSANFVAQHPALFKATGETEASYGVNVEMDLPIYDYAGGITIVGTEPKDDVELPAGKYDAMPGYDMDGKPAPLTESGDPSTLPYLRHDTPDIAPVAVIGMDVLGDYDFCFYRNFKLLLVWPPEDTDKLFPLPTSTPRAHHKHKRHQDKRPVVQNRPRVAAR